MVTGVSGSGKSSLAFDTLYAEGQRRYVESLSAYARQFLGQMEKPDVDSIEGLSPAIAIEQSSAGRNPRSTVATITEIYDYLRLLFARARRAALPAAAAAPMRAPERRRRSSTRVLARCAGTRVADARAAGARPEGRVPRGARDARSARASCACASTARGSSSTTPPTLDKKRKHTTSRSWSTGSRVDAGAPARLADSLETALGLGDGLVRRRGGGRRRRGAALQRAARPARTAASASTSSSRGSFSFNSPYGACPACDGLGSLLEVDPERVVPDPRCRVERGRDRGLGRRGEARWHGSHAAGRWRSSTASTSRRRGAKLPADACSRCSCTAAASEEVRRSQYRASAASVRGAHGSVRGRDPEPAAALPRDDSRATCARWIESFMSPQPCPACGGRAAQAGERWRCASSGANIGELGARSRCGAALARCAALELAGARARRSPAPILKEIRERLGFLVDVGLDYLTLDRAGRHALRRRGAAHPAGHADRLAARRRALHPRRAVDRPAPARQRAAAATRCCGCATWATR